MSKRALVTVTHRLDGTVETVDHVNGVTDVLEAGYSGTYYAYGGCLVAALVLVALAALAAAAAAW